MSKTAFVLAAVAVGLGAFVFGQQSPFTTPAPEIGKAAPAFTLPDTQGKNHSLSDFKGKWVVLEWTNAECPVVVQQYRPGVMQATQKWSREKGAVWLQIVSSAPGEQGYVDAAKGEQVRKETKANSTAKLLDPKGQVGRAYHARTTPHLYVINPEGQLVYMGGFGDQNNPSATDNHVVRALSEGMAGKAISTPVTRPYGCSVKYGN